MNEVTNREALSSPFRGPGGYQAIILAGGLGTRLRSAVPDLPKCMAPVAGKPFLHYVIAYLQQQGVTSFIFSLGYLHEFIEDYINKTYPNLEVQYSIEDEPLGTGGAIQHACSKATEENLLVLNGDTMYKIDVEKLLSFHTNRHSSCTLALKPMEHFERYGVVEINQENYIQSFKEKQFYEHGLINGGVYGLNVAAFLALGLPTKFSFEKDYLEKYFTSEKMIGIIQDEYFIDIGIPEDFAKADKEFKIMN
ncbi:MAG: nucleotidyltransferase family protein [Ferruginibacter sp.]